MWILTKVIPLLTGSAILKMTEMRENLVKPQQAHYRILIHACAKVGHTKKAFQLFTSFKKKQLKKHVGIYTDLFLSCSLSEDKIYALEFLQNWVKVVR